MAVTFVIGRAGSGKTRRCVTSIANALRADPLGPPIYWILPKQATFTTERQLTCDAGLPGYVRARVVSFEQLGHDVLAECGGGTIPEVTPLGRQMLLGHILRRSAGELRFFRAVARQPGLVAKLDATFAEFERAGKDAADLDALLRQAAIDGSVTTGDALLDKAHDLQLVYRQYTAFLGQERLDQHRRLLQVLGCIESSARFRHATVYCDGFLDFSEYERQILAKLGKVCRHLEITLPLDASRTKVLGQPDLFPEDHSLFHRVEIGYRRLRLLFREQGTPVDEPPVVLNQTHRFTTKALQEVERRGLGTPITYVCKDSTGVEFVEAPTRAAEVDAAARRILQLTRGGSYRLRDVAVIVRDLAAYHDAIDASFREHGIRYFADRRRGTAHHPLLQLVRALLALAQGNWPHEAVMALLKTDLTGLTPAQADELENYVLQHRIRGDAWATDEPWQFHHRGALDDDDDDDEQDARQPTTTEHDVHRRRLIAIVKPFVTRARAGATTREIVSALFDVLTRLPVRQQIAKWMQQAQDAGDFEAMAEHAQVWTEVVALFDEMVELLGSETVQAAAFQEILEAGLDRFDLALTPPTVDEVLVGQADRTRTPPNLRAVLVLGLNEGVFPQVPHEDSVLSDADRRFLQDRALDVAAPTARKLLDEDLLAYLAFTRGSDLLYLSRSRADAAGRELRPSSYWMRLRRMFPTAPFTNLPREARDLPDLIATPRQLVAALARWVRHAGDGTTANTSPWPALYQWLAASDAAGAVADAIARPWRALAHTNASHLSPGVAARLFPAPLRATPAQLETFAACPFQHFLRFGLRLRDREDDADVSAMDLGSVYHHVLEHVVRDLLKQRRSWADLSDAQKQRLIRSAADDVSRKLRGEILLSTARNRYLLQRIERTLGQVVATQKTAAGRGHFQPAHARVRFGEGGQVPELALPTPAGKEVRLSGKIDRVDVNAKGDEAAVIDYRLGNNALALAEVYHGLALQLLTYLLVLEAHGEALAGRKLTPAAAFYVRMLRWLGDVNHPDEAVSPEEEVFHLQAKARGLLDERVVAIIDHGLQPGQASEVVHATLKADGTFGSKGRSDLAGPDEFAALLAHVKLRIGQLADDVLSGNVAIRPYMLGQSSPCPQCDYRPVCRFEPAEGYRPLRGMSREDVLLKVLADCGSSGDAAAPAPPSTDKPPRRKRKEAAGGR